MARRGDGLYQRGKSKTWWLEFVHDERRQFVRLGKRITRTDRWNGTGAGKRRPYYTARHTTVRAAGRGRRARPAYPRGGRPRLPQQALARRPPRPHGSLARTRRAPSQASGGLPRRRGVRGGLRARRPVGRRRWLRRGADHLRDGEDSDRTMCTAEGDYPRAPGSTARGRPRGGALREAAAVPRRR